MHLTPAQAKAIGIEGGVDCGTITLADALAERSAADALKTRLEMEESGTRDLIEQLKIAGIPEPRSLLHPNGQVRFHPIRRWRFDLAWEEPIKLAVELQGVGTHSSVKGLTIDSEKACEAAVLGWTVLPVLYKHVRDGRALNWIEAVYRRLAKV